MCQETRDFKGNTSNLWSHLAKSKDEQHIEAHNSIKDKCQPPKKKTMTADNVPERLMDHDQLMSKMMKGKIQIQFHQHLLQLLRHRYHPIILLQHQLVRNIKAYLP